MRQLRLIRYLLPSLATLLVVSGTAHASPFSLGRQVVTAAEIRDAGLVRLSEIVLLADDWSSTTLDGATWWSSPGGLEPMEGQDFTVMIDGIPIDLQLFDTQSLDRLPISLTDIDSVEFFSEPVLHEGMVADRGLIDIHTSSAGGAKIKGRLVTTRKRTGVATPGTRAELSLIHRSSRIEQDSKLWYALHFGGGTHPVRDGSVLPRILTLSPKANPEQSDLHGSLRLAWEGERDEYRLLLGGSSSSPMLFFFVPYGREIPTAPTLGILTLSSRIATLSGGWRLRFGITSNALNRAPNRAKINFDYHRTDFRASAEYHRKMGRYTAFAGVHQHGGFEQSQSHKNLGLGADALTLGDPDVVFGESHLYANLSGKLKPSITHSAWGDFDIRRNVFGMKFGYRIVKQTRHNGELALTTAYAERLFDADPAAWVSYAFDSYAFLSDTIRYIGPGRYTAASVRQYMTDLEGSRRLGERIELGAGVSYRFVPSSILPGYEYGLDSTDHQLIVDRATSLYIRQSGNLVGFHGSLGMKLTPNLSQRFAYNWLTCFSGDSHFVDAWRTVPEHHLSWSLTWTTTHRFHGQIRANWQSETVWKAYSVLADSSSSGISDRIAPILNLDIVLGHSFFAGALDLSLIGRNLLNEPERRHPAGAEIYPRLLLLQLQANLGR